MRKIWISYVAAVALLACASQAVAQATDAVKAAPAPSASAAPSKGATAKPPANAKKQKLVNLNAASRAELKALPGGSDAEADRIIAGRPYNSKAVLVTNNVISDGRYAMIRKLVVAGEPAAKSAKTAK